MIHRPSLGVVQASQKAHGWRLMGLEWNHGLCRRKKTGVTLRRNA